MSRLGKIGLFLNLALALVFAAWGFGLYSNHVKWEDLSADRGKEIKAYGDARNAYWNQLVALQAQVIEEEARLPVMQKWYRDRLESLRNGKDGQPVLALQYDKGKLILDAKKMPKMGPLMSSTNQPIQGLAHLDQLDRDYQALLTQISKTIEETSQLVAEQGEITKKINGDKGQKGLRGKIADEQAADKKSVERQEELKPILYNRLAELEILNKRHEALVQRLKQLQGARVVSVP